MTTTHVIHEIEPVYNKHSRVLLLGTMPSPKSRETGFFYGHSRNRFWKVLAALFDEPIPETIEEKRDLCLRHNIALWDVLSSCDIEGASDASIKNAKPNNLSRILKFAPIQAVFTTGTKAGQLYKKLCEPTTNIPCIVLPSTSPANSRMHLSELCTAYKEALTPYLGFDPEYPILDVPEVVRLEQSIAASGTSLYTLMHRAGRFLAYEAEKMLKESAAMHEAQAAEGESQTDPNQMHISILCGHGNNGGDGWVAADYLVKAGYHVDLISSVSAQEIKAEPAHTTACEIESRIECIIKRETNYNTECRSERETKCDIEYKTEHETRRKNKCESERKITASPKNKQTIRLLINPMDEEVEVSLSKADLIIDAILGTGFSGDTVREPFATWIELANQQKVCEEGCEKLHDTDHFACNARNARNAHNMRNTCDVYNAHNARIIAADIASGFSAQTGTAAKPCIMADRTVTMITLKTGLVQPNAKTYCGSIRVAPLADFDL